MVKYRRNFGISCAVWQNICVLRSHTDENGKIVTAELATALAGNEKTGYYITVASDLFSLRLLYYSTQKSEVKHTT